MCYTALPSRVTISQKTGSQEFYLPVPWTSSTKKYGGRVFFYVWAEKKTNQNNLQKNTLSQRAVSYFYTTEDGKEMRAGENE